MSDFEKLLQWLASDEIVSAEVVFWGEGARIKFVGIRGMYGSMSLRVALASAIQCAEIEQHKAATARENALTERLRKQT